MRGLFATGSGGSRRRSVRSLLRRARIAGPRAGAGGKPPEHRELELELDDLHLPSGEPEQTGPGHDQLVVEQVNQDGRHTLSLRGELSLDSVDALEAALRELRSPDTRAIVLDLRGLVFIDSSGLWGITTLRKWCAHDGIELSIIPGPESVQSVFEVTGLSDLLPFEADGGGDSRPR